MPDFSIEQNCGGRVAGVDEAGRGPWAGPVVAAAVILPATLSGGLTDKLDDSKKLSAVHRQNLYSELISCPGIDYGVGAASVAEIERNNILAATCTAMRRALQSLNHTPDTALIDGNQMPTGLPCLPLLRPTRTKPRRKPIRFPSVLSAGGLITRSLWKPST